MSLKIPSAKQEQRDRRSLPCQLALQDHNYASKIPSTPSPPPPPPLPLPLQPTKELSLYNPVLESYKEQFPKNQCDLSSQPSSTEIQGLIEEIILPEEVWMLIWSYLDFDIIQKICSCVSKSWFEMIRRSKFSWEMRLRKTFSYDLDFLAINDLDAILFHWENLRVLHFSSELEFVRLRLSYLLSSHKSLEKIVIPSDQVFFTKDDNMLGVLTKYWLDPRHIFAPDAAKNAIRLKMYIERLPEEFAMQQNGYDLSNLETLDIEQIPNSLNNPLLTQRRDGMSYDDVIPKNELLSKFNNLKWLTVEIEIHIDFLLDIVRFLGSTKTVKISAIVEVKNDYDVYDEEDTKKIFNEALEIMKEKFPAPATRILDLRLSEDEGYEDPYEDPNERRRTTFSIICDNRPGGVILTTSDDTSDSSDESVNTHDYDSMDESVEKSDSFGESDENSDSMDESDENSETMDESDEDSENEDHMNDPDPDYWNNGMIN